jgi:hypothetical protein
MFKFTEAKAMLEKALATGRRAHTLAEFDAEVRKFADEAPAAKLWFRGHENVQWHLRPPALRESMPHRAYDYTRREAHMFVELKRRGVAFVDPPPRSDWGWLYLAQHHGVPTRLLDWSEGSHIALYFALASRRDNDTSDACVWALNPGELNRRNWGFSDVVTLETEHPEPAILLNPYRHGTKPYREAKMSSIFKDGSHRRIAIRKTITKRAQRILAVIPEHVTARLRAQRGAFVAFADDPDALLEQILEEGTFEAPLCVPIIIDGSSCESLEQELDRAGVASSTVYPDMTGFGGELARRHNLWRL